MDSIFESEDFKIGIEKEVMFPYSVQCIFYV